MGIRFYCPNGHRLHVKSFLAGKRGICPHCAARFRIPPESEIPRGSPKIKPNSGAGAATSNGKRHLTTATITASTDSPADAKHRSPATGPTVDPIAEAPEAIWYVRPPSGGQFGPAKGEVMRKWIVEGRVSADSLVWREGWPDWLTAGPVFPTLNPTYTASTATMAKRETVSLQLQSAATEPTGSRPTAIAARAATPPKSLTGVIVLVLIVVALLAVLVYVLTTKS